MVTQKTIDDFIERVKNIDAYDTPHFANCLLDDAVYIIKEIWEDAWRYRDLRE